MRLSCPLAILLLTLFLAGATASAEAPAVKPTYKIGFVVSLTGGLAEFGEAIRNGVTLAREENPSLGEVFEPIYEDSKYESKVALASFRKLTAIDKVNAVYVFGGPMTDTLAPIAEKAKVPTFSTEYDERYTRGRQFVFRFANNATDYAQSILSTLRERGARNFGIVKVENQYHNTLSEAFIGLLSPDERAEVVENFSPGETDFRSAIVKIQKKKFDAFGVYLIPGMQNAFLRQMHAAGFRAPLFGTDSFESSEENRGVEDLVRGAIFANSSVSEAFIGRYGTRFGKDAQIVHAALAYEFAKLLGTLFSSDTAPISPDEFAKRFAFSEGRESVFGEYFYRKSEKTGQYFSFPLAVREVIDGGPRVVSIRPAP